MPFAIICQLKPYQLGLYHLDAYSVWLKGYAVKV